MSVLNNIRAAEFEDYLTWGLEPTTPSASLLSQDAQPNPEADVSTSLPGAAVDSGAKAFDEPDINVTEAYVAAAGAESSSIYNFAASEDTTGDVFAIADAASPGVSALLAQTFANGAYSFSGNQNTDAVLIGSRWTDTTITYSFPTSGSFYGPNYTFGPSAADGRELAHVAFNAAQQQAVRYALNMISSFTGLTFVEVTESANTHARLRFSQTSDADVGSAQGMFPSPHAAGGDVWFGMTNQPFYLTPGIGNWGLATIMHEIGHAMGLKHGHDNYTTLNLNNYLNPGGPARFGTRALTPENNGQAWSLMSYHLAPGFTNFGGEGFNQPQTYMMHDMAALQYLYGGNYTANASDSVYTLSPTTGEMFINGVGQGAPADNTILRTLWDGGGNDIYDLSNYTTNLDINLAPGAFSTFDPNQLADHNARNGGGAPAPGNVANALMINGDIRSLIENARGGSGNDTIRGNQTANTLDGGNGDDLLIGQAGNDVLRGGANNDTLYGDNMRTVVPGDGLAAKPAGLANDTRETALNISGNIGLRTSPAIENSATQRTVSVTAAGDGTVDWYRVDLDANGQLIVDIDQTDGGIDTVLKLYNAAGTLIGTYDDSSASDGGTGSTSGLDSFARVTLMAGTYYVKVTVYVGGNLDLPVPAGTGYQVQFTLPGQVDQTVVRGDDRLFGDAGNDLLHPGTGSDSLDGGTGTDTVILSGLNGGGFDLFQFQGVVYALDLLDRSTDTISAVELFNGSGVELAASNLQGIDPLSYAASYNDLAQAFRLNFTAALSHYTTTGFFEGREINFNPAQYLANYADLRGVFGTDNDQARNHFVAAGVDERRMANDPLDYIASYADLIGAFGGRGQAELAAAGLSHYAASGMQEGRRNGIDFNPWQYLANYADLAAVFGTNDNAATAHFINGGHNEYRLWENPLQYIASYGDLITGFAGMGVDQLKQAAIGHFQGSGFGEGRRAWIDFEADDYLANYADLRATFVNADGTYDNVAATLHYIQSGYAEGRSATLIT